METRESIHVSTFRTTSTGLADEPIDFDVSQSRAQYEIRPDNFRFHPPMVLQNSSHTALGLESVIPSSSSATNFNPATVPVSHSRTLATLHANQNDVDSSFILTEPEIAMFCNESGTGWFIA